MVRSEHRPDASAVRLRRLRTDQLSRAEVPAIRILLEAAFGQGEEEERFSDDDWQHSIGGIHVVADVEGHIVAHAAVVERRIHVADRPLRSGYVEAVAVAPDHQGRGLGTLVMEDAGAIIDEHFELGVLATGLHDFYARFGWQSWLGPSSVRTTDGEERTEEEDGYLMVLPTRSSPPLDLRAPIACEWRPGDVW